MQNEMIKVISRDQNLNSQQNNNQALNQTEQENEKEYITKELLQLMENRELVENLNNK